MDLKKRNIVSAEVKTKSLNDWVMLEEAKNIIDICFRFDFLKC